LLDVHIHLLHGHGRYFSITIGIYFIFYIYGVKEIPIFKRSDGALYLCESGETGE